MLTSSLLQVYAFLIPLELLFGKIFGIDTIWKPYRVAAMLVVVVALVELPYRGFDKYDKRFAAIFLTGCGLSFVWLIVGVPEPVFVLREGMLVLIPFSMYLCIKLSARTPEDLAGLIRAFVLGAFVDASYSAYEVVTLGHTWRPAGLSGAAPENLALHAGLAFAFVLYPYPGRSRATWLSVLVRTSVGAMLCFAIVISGTRAAWMGLVFSTAALACVMALSRSQRSRLLKALVPTAVIITALAFNLGLLLKTGTGDLAKELGYRLVLGENLQTGAGRTEIWEQAADVAWDYYFIGGGFSGFMQGTSKRMADFHFFKRAEIAHGFEHGVGSHNLFLEVLIDYGPISLLLLSACLLSLIGNLFREVRNANTELSPHGMLYCLLFLLVCGLFRDLIDIPDFWIVMAFVTLFVRQSYSVKAWTEGIAWRERLNNCANPTPLCE